MKKIILLLLLFTAVSVTLPAFTSGHRSRPMQETRAIRFHLEGLSLEGPGIARLQIRDLDAAQTVYEGYKRIQHQAGAPVTDTIHLDRGRYQVRIVELRLDSISVRVAHHRDLINRHIAFNVY